MTKLDKIGNAVIRTKLEILSIVNKIERQQVRWFGHTMVTMNGKSVK